VSDATHRLSGEEVEALRFAMRRQLTRWANKGPLQQSERQRRDALAAAARVLDDKTFAHGIEVRASNDS
jgi:hypothetical protein